MDGRPIRKKVAFLNENGYMWTGPFKICKPVQDYFTELHFNFHHREINETALDKRNKNGNYW